MQQSIGQVVARQKIGCIYCLDECALVYLYRCPPDERGLCILCIANTLAEVGIESRRVDDLVKELQRRNQEFEDSLDHDIESSSDY